MSLPAGSGYPARPTTYQCRPVSGGMGPGRYVCWAINSLFDAAGLCPLQGIRSHIGRYRFLTLADGCAKVNTLRFIARICFAALPAWPPTSTTAFKFGNNLSNSAKFSNPARRSAALILSVPFHPGMTFHNTTLLHAIPASTMKVKMAFAVGSSLLREMMPEPTTFDVGEVIGPGFSSRNNRSASTPPLSRAIPHVHWEIMRPMIHRC